MNTFRSTYARCVLLTPAVTLILAKRLSKVASQTA